MANNDMKVCLVNLFDLDPPRNGGLSRVAFTVSELMAQLDEQGEVKVVFAVGWRFSGEFRKWLGRSGGEIVPVMPEAGLTPIFQSFKPDFVISPLFGMKPCADWDAYRDIPHIVSMPDALVLDKPELFRSEELQKRREVYYQLRNATKIVTISAHARQSLINHLDLREEQILVIPLAGELSETDSYSESTENDWRNVTSYVLYPARNWPHKRHEMLMNIMGEIFGARSTIQLVLTGWQDEGAIVEMTRKYKLPRDKIIELGYVTNEKMIFLYRHAEALMFVSEYEGFGMPILEAMQNGCPVICAPLTSIPEVAGDAALYVDSEDPKDWAQAFLEKLPAQRRSLVQKGYNQAKKFSWGHTQALWRKVIEEELAKITPQHSLTMPYLQELHIWANHFKVAQDEMYKKERVIRLLYGEKQSQINREAWQDLSSGNAKLVSQLQAENEKLQQINQNLLTQTLEKEKVVQNFRTSLTYVFQYGALNTLPFARHFIPLAIRLRDIRRVFLSKVGVLEQHAPKLLEVPEYYRTSPVVDSVQAPRISIVTPSYGQAAYIERTVKSVLDQGYPNLEYVVQDGGSTDGTIETLQPYLDRLKHFESRKDRGQAHAINLGVKHTSGEIMAYLNSDDILLPGSLNYVADYFLKHPDVDVIYSHRVIINENDEEIGRWILPRHDNNVILWADYVPQETLFWRRSIWEKAGNQMDESYQFALDWDMLVRFRNAGARMVRVPRFLAAFRVQSAQKTSIQMNSTGLAEMDRLRRRIHSRDVPPHEVWRHIKPYLNRSVIYHKLHWLGIFHY